MGYLARDVARNTRVPAIREEGRDQLVPPESFVSDTSLIHVSLKYAFEKSGVGGQHDDGDCRRLIRTVKNLNDSE